MAVSSQPRRFVPRKWFWLVFAIVILLGAGAAALYLRSTRRPHREPVVKVKPVAPADLARLRDRYVAGISALDRGDAEDAIRHFQSFDFGERAVEEYRLYYFANSFDLAHDRDAARSTLARLWSRDPRLVYREDAGFRLAGLYNEGGDWPDARNVFRGMANKTDSPEVGGSARWNALLACFNAGDAVGVMEAAREIAIRAPKSQQAADAAGVLQSVVGSGEMPLTPDERFERATSLLRDGDAAAALGELDTLSRVAPASLRLSIDLNRGLALRRMGRLEDSNRVLEPLASKYFKYAIPAIEATSRNYRELAAAINPTVPRTIVERKRVGTVRVRVGKGENSRLVTRPKYAHVKKTVHLVDLAKKAKKEEYERLATERLKDLLLLPISEELRLDVLMALISRAEAKNQDPYEQQLVREVIKLKPSADPGLQYFWNNGWAAYVRGDLNGAQSHFRFIFETYTSANVKRQAEYWYARAIARAGRKGEAMAIYQRLAQSPYEDLYALHAETQGATRTPIRTNPLKSDRKDWKELAEHDMPSELRLASELTALSDVRSARLEIQRNVDPSNQPFADALLADLYNSLGNRDLMYRSMRRAFPQLATVEQDSVPPYFLKLYYPTKYRDAIARNAARNRLDPNLVTALILQESLFDPKARSRVGAMGLMQLMPATGMELGRRLHGSFSVARLEDPETNIELGTVHLRHLIDLFGGNTHLAVASYNAGQGNVIRWRRAARGKPLDEFLESIPFAETRNYVKRVALIRSTYWRMNQ